MVPRHQASSYAMTSGVPQGTFQAFTLCCIGYFRNFTVLNYADDIKPYVEIKITVPIQYSSHLQADLNTIQ